MDCRHAACSRAVTAFFLLSLVVPSQVLSQFTDQTATAGIAFRHVAGGPEKKHIVETTGGGAAFFDHDNDGDLDLYGVNGATANTYRQKSGPGNLLYRNEGTGRFSDVTSAAGVGDRSWGMGCTVGDVDGDGYRDLYVTNYGPNILYQNRAGIAFDDITAAAGVAGADYSASAAFFDCDNDCDLDLYVTNYVVYDIDSAPEKTCTYEGVQVYCGPRGLTGAADVFYRNDGNTTFTDATRASGISWANRYYGLGVVAADFDNDGDTDVFVANDSTPNVLFRNSGTCTFTEVGLAAGVAYNTYGEETACMGVTGGDYDDDGDLDLYVTNFYRESNTLYRNNGGGIFEDVTSQAGLEAPTLPMLAWGTQFFDYDSDGDLDLFAANGHVYPQAGFALRGTSYPQVNQLFRNDGGGRFADVSAASGSGMGISKVSRGASFGDYDDDGDTDIFVVNLDDDATLLRNDFDTPNNWLVVQLFGRDANRDAVGARVRLVAGGKTQWRTVTGASSYLSYNDIRAHFGLGGHARADLVEVFWPDGTRQGVRSVPANRLLVVSEHGTHAVLQMGDDPYSTAAWDAVVDTGGSAPGSAR